LATKETAMSRPQVDDPLAPVHPGEILMEEFLRPHGLTPYAAARLMGVPRTRIERVARGEKPVTVDTARRLARLLGTSEAFWLNLQTRYDLLAEPAPADLAAITPLVVA
jgi:addiction module HigA family antidote